MHPSPENLKVREGFLTPDLANSLRESREEKRDYFTASEDFPKAFRIGSCSLESNEKATFQVLLFWRDDTKTEQKEVKVQAVKNGDKWLISNVVN